MKKLFGEKWKLVALGLIGLVYISLIAIYLFSGKPNSDEGWYLYASRLVYEGLIPYQDFAFPQTPFLPYIYGLPQKLFGPGIYVGRATSALFSVASFVIACLVAFRYGGFMAAVVTGFIMSSFTFWIYFSILTKTYASLTFCLLLILYLLSIKMNDHYKLLLIIIISVIAVGIRLSALPFAAVIFIYLLMQKRFSLGFYALIFLLIASIIALGVKFFLLPNFDSAYYHLFGFYTKRWAAGSFISKLNRIVFSYLPSISRIYALPILLYSSVLVSVMTNKKMRQFFVENSFFIAYLIGITLFVLIHFITGIWYDEYLLPAFVAILPVAGIGFSMIYNSVKTNQPAKKFLSSAIIAGGIIIFLNQGNIYLRNTNNFYKIPEMSAVLKENTSPGDQVMALEGILAVIDGNRKLIPAFNMGQFSYQDFSNADCERFHLVNDTILINYLKSRIAEAVLITQSDLNRLKMKGFLSSRKNPDFPEKFIKTLNENYYLKHKEDGFGHYYTTIYLYLRR